jgi:hypothetical protein
MKKTDYQIQSLRYFLSLNQDKIKGFDSIRKCCALVAKGELRAQRSFLVRNARERIEGRAWNTRGLRVLSQCFAQIYFF